MQDEEVEVILVDVLAVQALDDDMLDVDVGDAGVEASTLVGRTCSSCLCSRTKYWT